VLLEEKDALGIQTNYYLICPPDRLLFVDEVGSNARKNMKGERRNMKEATKTRRRKWSKVEKQTSKQSKHSRLSDICHSSDAKPASSLM
jgi:hypothetical protein